MSKKIKVKNIKSKIKEIKEIKKEEESLEEKITDENISPTSTSSFKPSNNTEEITPIQRPREEVQRIVPQTTIRSGPVLSGEQMYNIGKNFTRDSKYASQMIENSEAVSKTFDRPDLGRFRMNASRPLLAEDTMSQKVYQDLEEGRRKYESETKAKRKQPWEG